MREDTFVRSVYEKSFTFLANLASVIRHITRSSETWPNRKIIALEQKGGRKSAVTRDVWSTPSTSYRIRLPDARKIRTKYPFNGSILAYSSHEREIRDRPSHSLPPSTLSFPLSFSLPPCTPSPSKLVKEPFVWLTSLPVCYYTARYKVNSGTRILVYRSLRSRSWRRERAGSEAKRKRVAWIGCRRRWSSESFVVRTSRSDVKIFSGRSSKNGEAYLSSRHGCLNDYFRGPRDR